MLPNLWILRPKPQISNPKSQTLNPILSPQTPYLKPQTSNPKIRTPSSKLYTPNLLQTWQRAPIKQEYIYDIWAHFEHKVFIPRPIPDASHWFTMSKCMPFKFMLALTSCSITSRIIVLVCIIVNVSNCLPLRHVQVAPNYTIRLWGCIIVPMHTNELYVQYYVLWLVLGGLVPAQMQT